MPSIGKHRFLHGLFCGLSQRNHSKVWVRKSEKITRPLASHFLIHEQTLSHDSSYTETVMPDASLQTSGFSGSLLQLNDIVKSTGKP